MTKALLKKLAELKYIDPITLREEWDKLEKPTPFKKKEIN